MAALTDIPSKSAQLRLRAIQLQLATAFTFCSTCETVLLVGGVQEARQAIENVRHTIHWVRVHLDEPNHVPADSLAGVRDSLVELKRLVSRLEARL